MTITRPTIEDLKQRLLTRNRFDQAIEIQRGACNIRAIARVLAEAADACSTGHFVQPSEDPAVRLIVHQLAFLCNVNEIEDVCSDVYPKLVDACKSQANLEGNRT